MEQHITSLGGWWPFVRIHRIKIVEFMGWILRTKLPLNHHTKIKHLYVQLDTLPKTNSNKPPQKWWVFQVRNLAFQGRVPAFAVSFREGIQSSHGYNGIQIEHIKKESLAILRLCPFCWDGEWTGDPNSRVVCSWPPTNWDIKKGDGFNHLMTWTKAFPFWWSNLRSETQ